jgi:hypothetical protein
MKLVKEIKDRNGKLYFRRWRILTLPFVLFEVHEFFQDEDDHVFDKDGHLHNHPQAFITYIAEGGYVEVRKDNIHSSEKKLYRYPATFAYINRKCFHRVHTLLEGYCKTFILKSKKVREWGYLVDGEFVQHESYRANKNPK